VETTEIFERNLENLHQLSKSELIAITRQGLELALQERKLKEKALQEVAALGAKNEELQGLVMSLKDQLLLIRHKLYGRSSERVRTGSQGAPPGPKKTAGKRDQLPSERYPNAPILERDISLKELPECACCGSQMEDSGMTEDSEFLSVYPRQFLIVRQMRRKYRCRGCHGDLKTAPCPPRIKEGSSYDDEMIIDVSLSKYCDLIPIERYAARAGRDGLKNLPPQSLIEVTHYLADFVKAAYRKLKEEIMRSVVLHADETPHRMLEGDKKSQWYLWGFSTQESSYFEYHPTRSGEVASRLLIPSQCQYLVSDVFSGYGKAVGDTNKERKEQGRSQILHVYCNAHSRRKFREAEESFPEEAKFFIDNYSKIYQIEADLKGRPPDQHIEARREAEKLFKQMKRQAEASAEAQSSKSSLGRAMTYFLKNYEGLTRYLSNADLPIDNNPQERLLRNPVIGRKTWYGTHSKRGAETAAVLFSLVESCKLNKVNPVEYFKTLVQKLHTGSAAFTPREFKTSS
jgi:transposase